MSPEALERLRADVDELGTTRSRFTAVRLDMVDDLRALLDAYDTARAERDEALDALERFVPKTRGMGFGGMNPKFDRENAAAVLAKAGRR